MGAYVSQIFYCLNPSGRNVAVESTQVITEINTRFISWDVPIIKYSKSLIHLEP